MIMGHHGTMRMRRVYDPVETADGRRVLVDRLWPRGLRKDDPRAGQWLKDVAPSGELRRWYGHQPDRFAEFAQRYRQELDAEQGRAGLHELSRLAADGPLTLVTATKELPLSHLTVLSALLDSGRNADDSRLGADLERVQRWQDANGTWQVIGHPRKRATVALCRCDGGEEVDRFVSADPLLLAYLTATRAVEPS
jgi:uncharacterized protein YeaO (DUF488 family)